MQVEIDHRLISRLVTISKAAGSVMLDIYHEEDHGVVYKSDESPLTRADQESNRIICDGLRNIDPSIPIISEELDIPHYSVRKAYDTFWLIDPLDGTKEFIKRNDDFTTNIALIHRGKSILGVVYVPVTNTVYWGATGMGSFKKVGKDIDRISVRRFDPKRSGLVITCSRSHLNEDTEKYIAGFDSPVLCKRGSSLKMMLVAEGNADIYPRLGPVSEWDIAASQIIVEEAGGKVYKSVDGSDIIYNKENMLMPYFIAEGLRLT